MTAPLPEETPLDLVTGIMTQALTLASAALDEIERPPGRAFIQPGGSVAWDDCCDGQLHVRLIEMWPTGTPFPQMDTAQSCGVTMLGLRLGIGVIRCTPTQDENGVAPSGPALTENATGLNQDLSAIFKAINCDWRKALDGSMWARTLKIDRYTPLGPEGGCAGGEWQVLIGAPSCGCD